MSENEIFVPILEELKKNISLLNEVDEKDPRFKKNKDVKVHDATLGSIGEIIDSVLHPYREDPVTLEKIYCKFLDCDSSKISRDRKVFPSYKSKLILYALGKIFADSPYSKIELNLKTENQFYSLGNNDNDFDRIKIGPKKEIRISSYYHIGVQRGNGKLVIKTEIGYGAFFLHFIYKKGDEDFIDGFVKYLEDWISENNFYKKAKITPNGEFLELGEYDWEDVFLDEETKRQIVFNVISFFEKEKIYKLNGISAKCGLIWEGPPGTGKTLTAKILANKLSDITFIWVTPDDLHGSESVTNIYKMARELSPAIVFFEDADLFCVDRSMGRNNTILGEIMNQLDGLVPLEGVITIFTSNDPGVMEKALIDRPGRFDERIVFDPPGKEIITKMLKKFLTKPSYEEKSLPEVADKAEDLKLTGAHIKRLCDLATIYAINEDSISSNGIAKIKLEHFLKSLDKLKDMRIKAGSIESSSIRKNTNILQANVPSYTRESIEESVKEPLLEQKPQKKKSFLSSIVDEKIGR